ncbi:MAG: helix-turn-helix domain protein [Thermoleophilia bacterium]|nr:helix-turn-helix domain protein [Thermoleophilia bacterium]
MPARKRPRPTPIAVSRALREIGSNLETWRKLRGLTRAQVAERAGLTAVTLQRLEQGGGTTLENVLRVARVLGVADRVVDAVDPLQTDVGRMRAEERLPERVRPPRTRRSDG